MAPFGRKVVVGAEEVERRFEVMFRGVEEAVGVSWEVKERIVCFTASGYSEAGGDGGCVCAVHRKPQVGVPGAGGCNKKGFGVNEVVRSAVEGALRVCDTTPETRARDRLFFEFCFTLAGGRRVCFGDAMLAAVEAMGTGSSDFKAFGAGYCPLPAFRQGFFFRLARVFGPNTLLVDVMRAMLVCGRSRMKCLKLVRVSKGFYHVAVDKVVKGQMDDAGERLYLEMAKAVLECPGARVGGSALTFGEAPRVEPCGVVVGRKGLVGFSVVGPRFGLSDAGDSDSGASAESVGDVAVGPVMSWAEEVEAALCEETAINAANVGEPVVVGQEVVSVVCDGRCGESVPVGVFRGPNWARNVERRKKRKVWKQAFAGVPRCPRAMM